MSSSSQFFCQCQPIAQVNVLGAQIIRFDLSFECSIPRLLLSDVDICIKSKNTGNQWDKVELRECRQFDSQHFSLFVKENVHTIKTKLLHFDEMLFTQERLNLSIKMQFSLKVNPAQLLCNILPVRCLGAEKFQSYSFCDFTYSVYIPQASNHKHPLIICLHGAGEGGNNQSNLLADKMAMTFWNEPHQSLFEHPYILAPQCPSFWLKHFVLNGRTYLGERDYTNDLLLLVNQFISEHPDIDLQRIYIIGGSMGGYQGLRLFAAQPNLFAAALIACPAQVPTSEQLASLINKPIWFLHCNTDQVVPVENTQSIVHSLISQGNTALQTTFYEDVVIKGKLINPHCIFLSLYENQPKIGNISIFEWLIQQKGGHYDQ